MTTTHTNLALVEGEVIIYDPQDRTGWCVNYYEHPILYSTSKDENIPQLDRKHFVKPKVDVEELQQAYIHEKDLYDRNFMDSGVEYIIKTAFEDGINYNAKEAEFTREEMEECWLQATRKAVDFNGEAGFTKFMNGLRPLSAPKSVTLNENN